MDDEKLVLTLEARITEFEKRLRKADQTTTGTYRRMRQSSRTATQQMESDMVRSTNRINQALASTSTQVGTFAKSFGKGLLAGVATGIFAGITSSAVETVKAIAQVGDEAKRAGMSLSAFQEWKFVAEQNRIGVDSLVDGFKELNLRADEFIVTGGGSAAEAFERLGYTAEQLKVKLKDPSALMLEIIGRLQKVDRAAQIRISDELFGGSAGERFVELLDRGEAGIRDQIHAARDMGLVMDESMIRKAAELDAKFSEVSARLRTLWQQGVVEAALFFNLIEREKAKLIFDPEEAGRVIGEGMAGSLSEVGDLSQEALGHIEGLEAEIDGLSEASTDMAAALNEAAMMMRGLGQETQAAALTDLASQISAANGEWQAGTVTGEEYADKLRDITTAGQDTINKMGELDQVQLGGVIGQISNLLAWLGRLPAAAAAAKAEISSLALMDTGTPLSGTGEENLPPPPRSEFAPESSQRPRAAPPMTHELGLPANGGGKRKGGGKSRDEYAQIVKSLQEEIALLNAESAAFLAVAVSGETYGDAIEYARVRAELLHAAQQQGKAITPELQAEIDSLAQSYVTAGLNAEEAAERLRKVEEAGERGADAIAGIFGSVLDGSKSAKQAVADLLMEMAKVQMKKAALGLFDAAGGGGFLGAIGSLLGYSGGGYTGAGGTYEPKGIVHGGEYVFSKKAVQKLGVPFLEALHRGAPGYAQGGLVPGCEGAAEVIFERSAS